MSTSGLDSGCSPIHVIEFSLQSRGAAPSLSCSLRDPPRASAQTPDCRANVWKGCTQPDSVPRAEVLMGRSGVRTHRQQAPVGEAALTAWRDQAQVQRQAFPVTELCAFESREFLCFVCFRDFFKNKQTKR